MDTLTQQQRHANMAAIRSRDTKPEMMVRRALWRRGFRYRLNDGRLPGHPDLVLPRYRTCIFVNGCFWHGHGVTMVEHGDLMSSECCKIPKSNHDFWVSKIRRNRERDDATRLKLKDMGWNVIQVWECELRPTVRQQTLQRLLFTLSQIMLDVTGSVRHYMYADNEEECASMVADDGMDYLPANLTNE